ncbi:MAG: helix-turn-helix domain-containing protein [Myxococcota bacterium]
MREDSNRPSFGAQVRAWRAARGISQRALEGAIGKQRGYVAHLEGGSFIPPPRPVCDQLAQHLGIEPDDVWSAAVEERMKGLDPDLFAVYAAAVAGAEFRDDERRLVEALRRIDSENGLGRSITPSLLRVANLLAAQWSGSGKAVKDPDAVLRALFQLDDCSHRTVGRVMEVLVGVIDVVGLEREHLGFSRE